MYVADLGAGRTGPLAGRRRFAFDEASIGSESLDGLEATDVVDLVEEGEGEDLPDAGDGVEAEQGVGIVRPSLSKNTVLQIPNETIVGLTEGQVSLDALSNDGVREGTGNRRALALVDQGSLGPGQIVLVEGVLDVGHELAPFAGEMQATAKQVPRGPHLGRVGVGLGQKTSTEKAGDLQGVDSVVLGLGPVDGPHVEGVAKDEGDVVFGAEVGEPVPVEDALGSDDEVFPERFDGLEEDLAIAGKIPMEQDLAFGVLNAQIKGAGMQVDPAVMLMLAGVESHGSPPGFG